MSRLSHPHASRESVLHSNAGHIPEGKEVEDWVVTHHTAQVLAHEVWVFTNGLRDGAEDDALLRQLSLECGRDGLRVEHIVIGHVLDSRQPLLLVDGDAQLAEGLEQLRVHLIQAFLQRNKRHIPLSESVSPSSQILCVWANLPLGESAHGQQGRGIGTSKKASSRQTFLMRVLSGASMPKLQWEAALQCKTARQESIESPLSIMPGTWAGVHLFRLLLGC